MNNNDSHLKYRIIALVAVVIAILVVGLLFGPLITSGDNHQDIINSLF